MDHLADLVGALATLAFVTATAALVTLPLPRERALSTAQPAPHGDLVLFCSSCVPEPPPMKVMSANGCAWLTGDASAEEARRLDRAAEHPHVR